MTVQQIVVILAFGLVVGWLASLVMGGGNILKYIIWGLLGSAVGGWLAPQLGLNIDVGNPLISQIIVATLGAILVIAVVRLVS